MSKAMIPGGGAGKSAGGTGEKGGDPICLLDKDGIILYVNGLFRRLFQKEGERLIGTRCWESVHGVGELPSDCPLRSDAPFGERCREGYDAEGRMYDPVLYPLNDEAGSRSGSVLLFRSATAVANRDDAEKEELGALVAGLSHEINNPLDYVNNYLYLLSESLPGDFEGRQYLEKMQIGLDVIERVLKDLGEYARPCEEPLGAVELPPVIDKALALQTEEVSERRIKVTKSYGCGNSPVRGSEAMLLRAFTSLIENAVDAVGTGGSVMVATARKGATVSAEVRDSGAGIAVESLPRIFEPFFSMKKTGRKRRSSAGLALCRRIIKQHGGDITVFSREGEGTVFRATFPLMEQPVDM
jgi:signal transduction histidine kinase